MSSWAAMTNHSPQYSKMSEPQDNLFPKRLAALSDKALVSCVVITPMHTSTQQKRMRLDTVHTGIQLYLEDPNGISKQHQMCSWHFHSFYRFHVSAKCVFFRFVYKLMCSIGIERWEVIWVPQSYTAFWCGTTEHPEFWLSVHLQSLTGVPCSWPALLVFKSLQRARWSTPSMKNTPDFSSCLVWN